MQAALADGISQVHTRIKSLSSCLAVSCALIQHNAPALMIPSLPESDTKLLSTSTLHLLLHCTVGRIRSENIPGYKSRQVTDDNRFVQYGEAAMADGAKVMVGGGGERWAGEDGKYVLW